MLQVFKSLSNTWHFVARILLELVRVTTSPLTLNATLAYNAARRIKTSHVNSVQHIWRPRSVEQEPMLKCCEQCCVKKRLV